MTTLDSIRDFTELYLLPFHSTKDIEVVQYRVNRKVTRATKNSEDTLLKTVVSFRETLRLLNRMRRELRHPSHFTRDPENKLYFELLELSPVDCLTLVGTARYGLTDADLGLILKHSPETIGYRRNQLLHHLKDDGFAAINFASINPKNFLVSAEFLRAGRRQADQQKRLMKPGTQTAHSPRTLHFIERFQALPFYARFAVETLGVVSIIILLMWIIPEIRNTFENSVQKRINDYLIESSLVDSPAPAGTTKAPKAIAPLAADEKAEDEETAAPEKSMASRKQPRVVDGETWRFSFTGSQTNEIEAGIGNLLKRSGLDQKSLTVPGGIQFDLIVPTAKLIDLKTGLEEMTAQIQRKTGNPNQTALSSANLSWYKKRNMGTRKIPGGHVQAIIWISTL